MRAFRLTISSICLGLVLFPALANAVAVNFPDPNLEAAIRTAISKPTGTIDGTDLVGGALTIFNAPQSGITNLSGLEYCTDLDRHTSTC